MDEVFYVNLEALSDGESNKVDCFSSSFYHEGYDYYDCGECVKISDREGYLRRRTCIHYF
mgnify:CR=1 FL=1